MYITIQISHKPSGFRDFILRGNVVSLAVAVVVGTAFTALVDAFVADWITPLIAVIFQGGSFADLTFDINDSVFAYGHFINTLLTFLIICCILYFFVILPMNTLVEIYFPEHLQKDPEYRECPTCFKWEVDVRASKCPFCCTELVPLPGKKTPILLQEVLIEGEEIKVGFAENEAFEK